MKELMIVSLVRNLGVESKSLPEIVPNVVESAIFQAKIKTNGKKQTKIVMHREKLKIFVCVGGHPVSSKNFQNFQFSKYKIRVKNRGVWLMLGKKEIYDFSKISIEPNVIYWVSWKTKKHNLLKNREDVFYLKDGVITNKVVMKKVKYNKKHN